eukprot:scaffold5034_cov97-Isochrysis_galbana.AAC.1
MVANPNQPQAARAPKHLPSVYQPSSMYMHAAWHLDALAFLPTPFLFVSAMRAPVLSGFASNIYSISIVTGPIKRIIIPRGGIPWCLEVVLRGGVIILNLLFSDSRIPLDQLTVRHLPRILSARKRKHPPAKAAWQARLNIKDHVWEDAASRCTTTFLTPRDVHTHFKHIIHRALTTRER